MAATRWQAFETILPDLSSAWHLYAPDFRGHGKSSWATGSYRLQDYADDTMAFLRQVVREPACLFGHSLGGIVGLMVAAKYPRGVRAAAIGDAPLTSQSWYHVPLESQDRLAAWRDLSGGQVPMQRLVDALKDGPVEVPGRAEPVAMREVLGDDSPVFSWLATHLYQSGPDVLTALLERFEATAAGYEMDGLLPAIACPVLLLQADPAVGGLMTDADVRRAMPLLAKPRHVRRDGVSHVLHNERKEPVVEALKVFFREV
jgi:pimeloyl-ACP methyl ester carboxylesterase